MKNCMDEFMTTQQVAEILGVTRHSVNNYIAEGRLPATKVNAKRTVIAKADLESVKNNLVRRVKRSRFGVEKGVAVSAVVDKAVRDEMIEVARAEGVLLSDIVRRALDKYVGEAKKNG